MFGLCVLSIILFNFSSFSAFHKGWGILFNELIARMIKVYLILSGILFIVGIVGLFIWRKHILLALILLELLLLATNFNLVMFSVELDDIVGQIYNIIVLTVGAGETAIGIAILIVYYRLRGAISADSINVLKG